MKIERFVMGVLFTVLSCLWRFCIVFFDWRSHIRYFLNKDIMDAAFLTNMRDKKDRQTFLGKYRPAKGYFIGPRYWIAGTSGRTIALDCVAEDFATEAGRKRIRNLFVSAVEDIAKKDVKVVLLAASTKRLFEGDEIDFLKKRFPQITFTIGDNGTNLMLGKDTMKALSRAKLNRNNRIAVLGAYGFLGKMITNLLVDQGYQVIGVGRRQEELSQMKKKYGIEVAQKFEDVGKVDAVVACTHSNNYCLNSQSIDILRRKGKKLLVIDVAEPSNLKYKEYKKNEACVVRQDAGNTFSPKLRYVLGPVSYKMFRLSRGVTFGCFAETLSLSYALKKGIKIDEKKWFEVNQENMAFIEKLFKELGFREPSPRCFSKPIKSFDLQMTNRKEINFSHQECEM